MNKRILFRSLLGFIIAFHSCSFGSVKDKPNKPAHQSNRVIDADDPNIQYIGRFSFADPKRVVFDWPGVAVFAKFEGTSCSIRLNDGKNLYAVTVDNREPFVLKTDTNTIYRVAEGLADSVVHTVLIQKRTEAFIGKGEFLGFVLDNGKRLLSPDKRPNRRIEFIGNSITCGFGVEGKNPDCHFSPETENAAVSYAVVTARALCADYSLVAYSGRGVVRNYGDKKKISPDPMPDLYDRTCCFDSTMKWDFSSWIPQAVVINLGTNDFSTQPHPDKPVFQGAYSKLIDRIMMQYTGVHIFCVCGPMIGQPCLDYIREVVEQFRNNGCEDVHFIEVEQSLLVPTDWGCDGHPNVRGQIITAGVIIPVMKREMNW